MNRWYIEQRLRLINRLLIILGKEQKNLEDEQAHLFEELKCLYKPNHSRPTASVTVSRK